MPRKGRPRSTQRRQQVGGSTRSLARAMADASRLEARVLDSSLARAPRSPRAPSRQAASQGCEIATRPFRAPATHRTASVLAGGHRAPPTTPRTPNRPGISAARRDQSTGALARLAPDSLYPSAMLRPFGVHSTAAGLLTALRPGRWAALAGAASLSTAYSDTLSRNLASRLQRRTVARVLVHAAVWAGISTARRNRAP